jgi:hypothetical protein
MSAEALGIGILEWAKSPATGFDLELLDRESPDTIKAFVYALSSPADIAVVEHIEGLTKTLWLDTLDPSGGLVEGDAIACSDFFSELGFLFKYKPYGVKIASPFGYSIFNLRDGRGFSFQLHAEPKLEGFNILRTSTQSLVYLSSVEEWLSSGELWARSHFGGDGQIVEEAGPESDPPFVWRVASGDVLEVSTTEVVHSVLGCVLEEYASCSVDAVERLYDQNARSEVSLPRQHPSVSRILESCRPGQPLRLVERAARGWTVADWSDGDAAIKVEGDLWGSRVRLSGERPLVLPASGELKVVAAVDGPVEVQIGGRPRHVAHGSFLCAPPGLDISAYSPGEDCSVAVHCVSAALVRADWTR